MTCLQLQFVSQRFILHSSSTSIHCWCSLDCNRNAMPPNCELTLCQPVILPQFYRQCQRASVKYSRSQSKSSVESGWNQLLWILSPNLFSLHQTASQTHKRYSYQLCLVGVQFTAVGTVKWNLQTPEVCWQTLLTFMNSSVISSGLNPTRKSIATANADC